MKIALIGPVYPYRGGIVIYHTLLIQELVKQHEVLSVSFSRQYPAFLYPGKSDKDYSQIPPSLPVQYILDSINPLSWKKTVDWLCDQKPDLLVIEWWITFLAPAFRYISKACQKQKLDVMYIIHNVFPHEGGKVHRLLAFLALKEAKYYLTHTPAQERALLEIIPQAMVKTCPLPVYPDGGGLITPEERRAARQKTGLPDNASILLFFGIVRAYKGLMILLEAISKLRLRKEPVYLIVAGEFWDKKEPYVDAITRLGISEYVLVEDRYIPEEEVRPLFASADAVVAPYTGGTQSGIVSLARGFGLPIVMTDRSAAGMDLSSMDGQTIAPAGDVDGLVNAILHCLKTQPVITQQQNIGWQEVIAAIESFKK